MIVYLPLTRRRKINEIKQLYKETVGKELCLDKPAIFNEKIQWLKLNYTDARAKLGADKLTSRDMVAEIVGEKYLIPLIGVYDTVDDIDWEGLPNKFVVKISDGYNQHLICADKSRFDVENAKRLLNHWLRPTSRIYWRKGSYPGQYKNSRPKIIIEKYIGDKDGQINEYKFMYLSGKLAFILNPTDRSLKNTSDVDLSYFDTNWKVLNIQKDGLKKSSKKLAKPKTLKEMLAVSKKLAKNLPMCRVDLYEVDGEVKFGELTFTPDDGRAIYSPDTLDLKLGKMIKLPNRNNYNILEWKPVEFYPRAWLKSKWKKSLNQMSNLSLKRVIKAVIPHGALVLYRRSQNVVPKQDNQKTIDIEFLGQLTDTETLDLMRQEGSYVHFGQSAEDGVLNRIFQGKRDGCYVDVGAFRPTLYSNTHIFHKFLGWHGINIDASKEAIDVFRESRPNDTNLNIAIGEKEGVQKFTIYSSPACNTLSDENRDRQKKKGKTDVIRTENVMVKPLSKVLDEYLPSGTQIDILDVDIEGYDLQALETNDWSKYRPKVILIEDYAINTDGFNKSEVYKFMKNLDYRFFSHLFDTSIYVDNKQDLGL